MIYGSSRVSQIIFGEIQGATKGRTGPTGPTGPTGSTGNTGPSGNIGVTGTSIIGVTASGTTLTFISASAFYTFSNIIGITGVSGNVSPVFSVLGLGQEIQSTPQLKSSNIHYGLNPKDYYPYSELTDETVYFKSLSIEGTTPIPIANFVGISADSTVVYLYGATVQNDNIPLGNTGELIYVSGDAGFGEGLLKGKAAPNTKYSQNELQLIIDQTFSREAIFKNKNWNSVEVSPFRQTILFDGINYYGSLTGGSFGTSLIQNILFPKLRYNINTSRYEPISSNENNLGFTLGQSIILGITSGLTFEKINFINSTGISYSNKYLPQNITRNKIGSCYFCKTDNQNVCIDYVSQDYCQQISGSFSTSSCVDRVINSDYADEGACCIYNIDTNSTRCLNTTAARCQEFGGVFNENKTCSNVYVNGSIFTCPTDICTSSTYQLGKCCVYGRCYNLTQGDCLSIPTAQFITGGTCQSETSDPACCSIYDISGACCTGGNCTDFVLAQNCDGVFQGAGTRCSEVNCCGYSFSDNYFKGVCANACKAFGSQQIYSCLRPGDKFAGGYFVGFIGMPNPCQPFVDPGLAYGEPLECMIFPRGNLTNVPNWYLKTCKGISGEDNSGNIDYFARTHPTTLPKNALDSRCILKAGVPFVQQAYALDGITWPSEKMFVGGYGYNANRGAYSYTLVGSGLAVEYLDNNTETLYKYLASKVYGTNNIHIMWALIVAPEDVEVSSSPQGETGGSRVVSWGMLQGFHKPNLDGSPNRIVLEETPTYPVDGLLSTRIHDSSSKNNPDIWFRSSSGTDSNAYLRFSFGNGSAWGPRTLESEIISNKEKFKQAYNEMWNDSNQLTSAIRQISIMNEIGTHGYNDWYIPSIIELNYIYNNAADLNASMALNGDQVFSGKEYWSSTSVTRLKNWDSLDPLNKDNYSLENIDSQLEPYLADNRLTSTNNSFGLNKDNAYKFTMSVANGQKMLTQVFDDPSPNLMGMIKSQHRSSRVANLRPVRRIPLVVTCNNFYYSTSILNNYWSSGTTGCSSCLDHIEGMC